ncbi:hypothetical protein Q2T83_14050 [Fervidibacter sacchari]|jgi:hypothetical protein|uniref:Uncharacterized protein n=1 Tax=Candidatus Fervidibacter sacchari TaxID=1448929 RepID=A0ABT2EI43_9BACT|nr:hypothetical protein [Candidatus Fervidibacter sacchari]MCS3917611.1 hypothetical protein [Candidatus Fervidibacter sacchari]WKU15444.1 hypothetical protein Q2T83_14050 [Candidatus Fervidibacter sacchari]
MPKKSTSKTTMAKGKKAQTIEVAIPERIRLMLEARGWHFPPTEEEKRRRAEAMNRFVGMVSTPPEIIYAVALETDPTRLGLTMEDLEEMRRRFEKDASGNP